MSATVAVRAAGAKPTIAVVEKKTTTEPAKPSNRETNAASTVEAKLAIALEALTAIADENDFTNMDALFRMRRRAEEAVFRIHGSHNIKRMDA